MYLLNINRHNDKMSNDNKGSKIIKYLVYFHLQLKTYFPISV